MKTDLKVKEYKMAYSVDTKVGELLKDTHAVEILEKHVPGISKNPMISMASGMTIKSCWPCRRLSNMG
jgi:hypothetical protein